MSKPSKHHHHHHRAAKNQGAFQLSWPKRMLLTFMTIMFVSGLFKRFTKIGAAEPNLTNSL